MVVVGWARTLTFYPFLAIKVLFLLLLAFGARAFLTLGLVLGLAGCGWVCCGWGCCGCVWGWGLGFGPSFPSNSK